MLYTLFLIGMVNLQQGKADESIKMLEKCLHFDRFNSSYIKQIGCSLLFIGEHEKAIGVFDEALVYQSNDWVSDVYAVDNFRLALEAFGRALSLNSFHTAAVFAVGAVMHHHGDYDTALAKYRVGLKNCPDNARLWNNIGMSISCRNVPLQAICCLKRAHYLAPLEWKILYNLGLVHLEVKQMASAFHFLSAALQFNASSPLLYVILAGMHSDASRPQYFLYWLNQKSSNKTSSENTLFFQLFKHSLIQPCVFCCV
ncbi:TPR 8 and TPR 11 domain containing protein [Trichuris trichiura]|uniref:TPR 8 and TPR 11 domain containing protein n=1 Tax=Trichuris trichiura TaxID=36087 RepID=A0A077ZAL0_TRITR|nr:TPR 8 and TPR 11 domain containing protein [Trichuris trichiura]